MCFNNIHGRFSNYREQIVLFNTWKFKIYTSRGRHTLITSQWSDILLVKSLAGRYYSFFNSFHLLICKFLNIVFSPSSQDLTHFCQQSSRHSSHMLILSQKLLFNISRKLFNNIQIICLLCLRKVFRVHSSITGWEKSTLVKTSMSPHN